MKSRAQIRREHEHDRALSPKNRQEQFKWNIDEVLFSATDASMMTGLDDPSAIDRAHAACLLLWRALATFDCLFIKPKHAAEFLSELAELIQSHRYADENSIRQLFDTMFENPSVDRRRKSARLSGHK